jgi:outer membrane protein
MMRRHVFVVFVIGWMAAPAVASSQSRVLTLDEALRTAIDNQPLLRQAQAETEAAKARADQARAPLLPQVSGAVSYERTTANFTARPGANPRAILGTTPSPTWDTFNFFNLGISARELIYDFGQSAGKWRSAKAGIEAQKNSERAVLLETRIGVRTGYFTARAAKALVNVARETLANQERHLSQIEGFVEIGTRPEIDLAQARTDRANARVQLINAENDYQSAKVTLNQAMGIEGPIDYDVADESFPAVSGEDQTADVLIDEARRSRPELTAQADQIRSQELTVRAIRGEYGPSLVASTGLTDVGEQIDDLAWNWNAVLGLSWPLFEGNATRARLREAKATLSVLNAKTDTLRQQIRLEVEQARLFVRSAKEALSAAGEAVLNARERLRLAEGRYETGLGSVIELSDAQLALTSTSAQEIQAHYNLASARAQLIKALGRE